MAWMNLWDCNTEFLKTHFITQNEIIDSNLINRWNHYMTGAFTMEGGTRLPPPKTPWSFMAWQKFRQCMHLNVLWYKAPCAAYERLLAKSLRELQWRELGTPILPGMETPKALLVAITQKFTYHTHSTGRRVFWKYLKMPSSLITASQLQESSSFWDLQSSRRKKILKKKVQINEIWSKVQQKRSMKPTVRMIQKKEQRFKLPMSGMKRDT